MHLLLLLCRVVVGGAAAAGAWFLGLRFVFGPAQGILSDPDLQSAKFLAAFFDQPPPRHFEDPHLLYIGLFVIGVIYSAVYAWIGHRLAQRTLNRGLAFGLLTWLVMVPWFEFYLPWNVMREPMPLVLLECACWLAVMLMVGVAIALTHRVLAFKPRPQPQ